MYYITLNVHYVRYSTGRKIKYFIVFIVLTTPTDLPFLAPNSFKLSKYLQEEKLHKLHRRALVLVSSCQQLQSKYAAGYFGTFGTSYPRGELKTRFASFAKFFR
jgi:hypothetical protein